MDETEEVGCTLSVEEEVEVFYDAPEIGLEDTVGSTLTVEIVVVEVVDVFAWPLPSVDFEEV